jgi:hypothetical protein
MRIPPRLALVPLAVLVSIVPFTFSSFVGPAGADSVADCQTAFSSADTSQLVYTTDPPIRLAYTGQTVSLSATWDPAAWDSLSSAAACIRLDEDIFDEALGTSQASPTNGGAFGHSFVIPESIPGTRLCTRIRLAGDPAGEPTEAVWVSKMHCFEVDHDLEEETPPEDTTQPPATTATTVPTASPATSEATPNETPAAETPASPEGGGSPVGTPFDSPATPAGGPGLPAGSTTPEAIPLLPATGYASPWLLHQGMGLVLIGLGLLVIGGRSRRRRQTA